MKAINLLDDISIDSGDDGVTVRETSTAAGNRRLTRPIVDVALAVIVETSPLQTRQAVFDPATFPEDAELLSSVQQFGVIEPIFVQQLLGNLSDPLRYRLIFGNRRLAAARAAGLEKIPAMLARTQDAVEALTIVENSGRRDLTPYEKALILIYLKEQTPAISVAELVVKTGWPQPTIYSLLAAYEKSAPVLRRVFAEGGIAPRTIQAMQPIYEKVPEAHHESLAEMLTGRTHDEIEIVRSAAQAGEDPLVMLQAMPDGRDAQKATSETNMKKVEESTVQDEPVTQAEDLTRNQKLDLENAELLREIAEVTGASRAVVMRLMQSAIDSGQDYSALFIACYYVGRGGSEETALQCARMAFAKRGAGGMLRREIRHLQYLHTIRRWIADLPNLELQQFLAVIFGG